MRVRVRACLRACGRACARACGGIFVLCTVRFQVCAEDWLTTYIVKNTQNVRRCWLRNTIAANAILQTCAVCPAVHPSLRRST